MLEFYFNLVLYTGVNCFEIEREILRKFVFFNFIQHIYIWIQHKVLDSCIFNVIIKKFRICYPQIRIIRKNFAQYQVFIPAESDTDIFQKSIAKVQLILQTGALFNDVLDQHFQVIVLDKMPSKNKLLQFLHQDY